MNKPLLSIVIANYNYGRFLEEAIQSVIAQNMGDKVELIICDAASTDNSVDIIKKYAGGLPPNTHLVEWLAEPSNTQALKPSSHHITWWCSGKDGGQSAAFNKGFAQSKGEWLTWLNSDDMLMPGSLQAFAILVKKRPAANWITGNMLSFDDSSKCVQSVNWGPHVQPPFLKRTKAFNAVFGPTTFFRRRLYDVAGPMDENMHFAMDTEYWSRLTMMGERQIRLNSLCWAFRIHQESKTEGVQTKSLIEKRLKETVYWREKTGYGFVKSYRNPYYLLWIAWRVFDGSWLARMIIKRRTEGHKIDAIMQKGV